MRPNKNNRSDFLSLFMAHHKAIYSYILAMVCNVNDADDLMQETAVFLWDRFEEYEPGTNFVAWARTVSKYKILQHHDKQKKDPVSFTFADNLLEGIEKNLTKRPVDMDEQFRALQECLEKLPQPQRQLLQEKYNKGLNITQIAESLGNSANALYKRMARIHQALLQCINRALEAKEVNL